MIQRLRTAEEIAEPSFQRWLQQQNTLHYDVYLSMNALNRTATGRHKEDVVGISHIYLDFDDDADASVKALFQRKDLPAPSYTLHTSASKWQVIWRVRDFDKHQAEQLQRGLARQTGADRAATDCARVLRFPGFYNHKYGDPFLVRAQAVSTEICGPDRFPRITVEQQMDSEKMMGLPSFQRRSGLNRSITQSERDWAYAKRALARGEPAYLVTTAIASYRRFDKYSPQDYAARTVAKAQAELKAEQQSRTVCSEPERG